MLNLEKIAHDAVTKALNSEELKEKVEKKITDTIEKELTDMFRSYSDFGKSFEAALKENMKLDVSKANFTEYNHWVTTAIKDRFQAHIERPTFNQIDNMLNEIMPVAKEVVALDDLIEKLRKGKDEYDSHHSGKFAVCFSRPSESYSRDYIVIGFDEEFDENSWRSTSSPKKAKDCECRIDVDIATRKVIGFDMGYRGSDKTKRVRAWRHAFESEMFRMYAAGSIIDLGDYQEAFSEMTPGDELDAEDLDIENSYEWAEEC